MPPTGRRPRAGALALSLWIASPVLLVVAAIVLRDWVFLVLLIGAVPEA